MATDIRYPVVSDPADVAAAGGPAVQAPAAKAADVKARDVAIGALDVAARPSDPISGAERVAAAPGARPAAPEPNAPEPATPEPATPEPATPERSPHLPERSHGRRWGRGFDPDRLAVIELRMWKAYYRRQPGRLFTLLVRALREQANVSLPRAALAAVFLTKAAAGFAGATGDYDRFAPDIARGYRLLGLPPEVDVDEVAGHELAWWVIRREMGLAAGEVAGESISRLYAALYGVPEAAVADAGRLRGLAAEVRDRGATADRDGPTGDGDAYWPLVARLLRESYRSLSAAIDR